MQDQVEQAFVCPVLIGRVSELAMLHPIVDQVQRGRGRLVLVSGEAGVGKSRLVAEVKAFAVRQGFLLLQGNCFQTDQALPYSPFLDLIRTQIIAPASLPALSDFHQFAQEFSRRFPELTLLTSGIAAPPAVPSSDPEQEKRSLFAMITRFFTTQVKRQPVLLLIEDLHWSDETSQEVLLHLARYCAHLPLLLLVTYREEEVTSALTHFLAASEREHHAQFLSLERLSRQEVEAMLQAIPALNKAVSSGLVESICTLTEGNPFFIEELLKSMLVSETALGHKGGWERKLSVDSQPRLLSLPQSIRATVHQRAAHLSPQAKQVLTLAAVAGRRFDFSVLQQILHCAEGDLLRLVKELIAAQLVVEESADHFSFRHALTREAIYAELLARERHALHRALAETLEQRSLTFLPEAYLADLSYHFFEAGVWAKALEYGQRAGERALALYAPRAALDHLTRAVQSLAHLPDLPPTTLYRARGKAYETLGEFELARDDYQQALALAQQARDTRLEWQSLLDLGFLWAERDYPQSGQWFHQALDLAKGLADAQLQAHSLNRLGNWLVNIGQAEEGVRLHQEALTLFETRHDTGGMAETLDLMGMGCGISGETIQSAERLEQAIALFRASGDQAHLISSLPTHVGFSSPFGCDTTYSVCASLEGCAAELAEARRLARQMESLPGQAYIEWVAGLAFASFGELGTGLRHAQEALRIATEIQHTQWRAGAYLALGANYLLLREANLAIEALEAGLGVAANTGSAWWTGSLRAYLALACLLKGALPRAEAVLQAGMARDHVPRNAPERRMLWAWGEVALANGEAEEALRLVECLLDTTPGPALAQPIPRLLYLRGKALLALRRSQEAAQVLEEARRGALARQEQSLLWQIYSALGHAYQRGAQRNQAQEAFAAARSSIAALAATIDDATIREQFSRSALTGIPRESRLLARRTEAEQFGGLTRRERAVAALIAQGKTNREIAEALVVGERTVETHVSHILSKLEVPSRRRIAAWAVDKGLHVQEQGR